MTSTQIRDVTPLAAAERELQAADADVAKIEREIGPTLDKFSEAQLTLDDLTAIRGPNVPEAKKARATIAALGPEVIAARRRLEAAERRRAVVRERRDSERRAIAQLDEAIAEQTRRVTVQADALGVTRRREREQEIALASEERRLLDLRRERATLTGEEDVAHRGAP